MLDERGNRISDPDILDRLADIGAVIVQRQPIESTDVATWRRDLRRAARARGLRVHIRAGAAGEGRFIVNNPDHVVDETRLRSAVANISLPDGTDK